MQYFQTGENNNGRRRVFFHLVDATDGITPEAGEAGGRPTISFNGGTPVDTLNTLVAIDASKGDYYLELSTTEIVYPGLLLLHYKSADTAHFAQECQIMAFDPYTQYGQFGSGGGVDVDYKKIQKMIDGAVSKIPKPIEPKEPDLVPISEGLQALLIEIRAIKIPETEKVDLGPVLDQLKVVKKSITDIEFPKTDLTPILAKLNEIEKGVVMIEQGQEDIKDTHLDGVKKLVEDGIDKLSKTVDKVAESLDNTQMVVLQDKPRKEEIKKPSVLEEYLKLK
jgi:hypothetical protein